MGLSSCQWFMRIIVTSEGLVVEGKRHSLNKFRRLKLGEKAEGKLQ